ncbi:MAG: DUF3168 domain-containing protein [Albidovulum sp.]
MSVDPSLALQKAIYEALTESPAVAGGRVFDHVPEGAEFPYISFGTFQSLGNRADCYDGTESFFDINVWSRAVGFPEAKGIADRVREVIDRADLAIDGHTLELLDFQDAQAVRDPDGMTNRVILSFRALSQPAD